MISYCVIASNDSISRIIITNNSTTARLRSPNEYEHVMVQTPKSKTIQWSRILEENNDLKYELTSSTCNFHPTQYFQKYGFLDIVDNHSPALRRN
jgi:excinuclease UvrABC helicase subunit UvrB